MTTVEFDKQFDIFYDNLASNGAPGINRYEKSVFFTKAQDDLVRSIYSPFNQQQKGFEGDENRRTELKALIKSYSVAASLGTPALDPRRIDDNSTFFIVPEDLYYILQEEITVSSTDSCVNGKKIRVIPTTHDDYNISKKNPFRKPNKERAWRIDYVGSVEIISPYTITEYKMRYLKKPLPIILTDFENDPELQGMGLTVEGLNVTTECELEQEFHRNILDRAVELAILGYRENTLQSNVELNKRNV
jgi:hypothetical protein